MPKASYSTQKLGYSTVVQESMIMALGPFMQVSTSPMVGVSWVASNTFTVRTPANAANYNWTQAGIQLPEHSLPLATQMELLDSSYISMILSEAVLSRDWNSPEDNEAWADL